MRPQPGHRGGLTGWEIHEVIRARAQGETVPTIAARFHVSDRTVHRILAAPYECVHCGERFAYIGDATAHVLGIAS